MEISILKTVRSFSLLRPAGAVNAAQQSASACLARVRAALPEVLAATVVELASGRVLASFGRGGLRPERAAAAYTELIRQKQLALAALGLTHERIEDIMVSMREQVHLLRVSADGTRFLYVAASWDDTNLVLLRAVLRDEAAF